MPRYTVTRIFTDDLVWIRTDMKEEFYRRYPEFDGKPLSDAFMIRKLMQLWKRVG